MDILVSVIVPVYNEEKYLEKCIDSLINQTVENYEIILIDDGSTDRSREICDKYECEKVRVVHQKNSGVSTARNTGLDIARGKFIVFVDSDDTVERDYIETFFKDLDEYDDSDLIISGRTYYYCESNEVYKELSETLLALNTDNWINLIRKNILCLGVVCKRFNKKIIDDNHLRFDVTMDLAEDLMFLCEYLQCIKDKKIVTLPKCTYNRFLRNGSLLFKYFPDRFSSVKQKEFNMFCETVKELGTSEKTDIIYLHQKFLYEFCICFKDVFDKRNKSGIVVKFKTARRILRSDEYSLCLKSIDALSYSKAEKRILKSKSVVLMLCWMCFISLKSKINR